MSEHDYDVDDNVEESPVQKNPIRARMRELENQVKEAKEQLAAAQMAQRELAFVKAGVDVSAPLAKYFVKGYEGELTPEAIRVAAEEAQIVPKSEQVAEMKSEQKAWDRIQKAAMAGDTSEPPVDWNQRISHAKSADEVMALLAQARQEAQNI